MNISSIRLCDIANGEGIRVSLFVSGCTHHCRGCFNSMTWDFAAGEPYSDETEKTLVDGVGKTYCAGLSVLGGEPFEPSNQIELVRLFKIVKDLFPQKDIWCWTGCILESELLSDSHWRCAVTDEMLSYIDVLVDGPFVEEKKDLRLAFRGSSNQRIIHSPGRAR